MWFRSFVSRCLILLRFSSWMHVFDTVDPLKDDRWRWRLRPVTEDTVAIYSLIFELSAVATTKVISKQFCNNLLLLHRPPSISVHVYVNNFIWQLQKVNTPVSRFYFYMLTRSKLCRLRLFIDMFIKEKKKDKRKKNKTLVL